MASSSAPVSVFDRHRFRKEFNQGLFNSHARKRKVIPEVGFNLNEDEYPQIMEQVALRGWRRLAAPRTNVSELMMQEFYVNAAVSEEEAAKQDELPYKSFVRGIKVDFSPSNIRRVMRFKSTTEGAETDTTLDAGVPLREFRRTPRIPELSYKTAKRMETIRFPRHQPQQQHEDDDKDEPMPQADGGNGEGEEEQQPQQEDQQQQQHGLPNF
ncbi:hypothetical protein PIB30_095081 [Stylosanthes scabra]|uniref:Uncharacterized protein n=1 Tax=Stylosanthes scabra TaxID=79078 RepID=A0ABU6ZUA1_9FABA|nr:hypothetical protein [Stylosanthes scabra]